ncbi:DNA polymerase III subunit gamma/tau [Variovorax sp. YR216]|uniref:DNA polymerase III subunit gamma/tau n=1 Tax=Variovorax sp. YR216 TaxID=1882828 RepID=UPI000B8427C3|nr:DNA polymerase III subunit gamma/tau [Variovorax sp. YR216]
MAYLVLARKHRPRTFSEMVGQEHVVQALENALTSQRLHHAYLFTGTRGVGKTTVSRILAKSLNCQGPDGQGGITATPCGICQACRDIDSGRFVDYTELDAASNRGVDEVQALLEQAVYKPVQGRFKVFMIDEVHMLTGHAFNAMLKTLEEPPEYLKFVLATTDPQKVPVTVLSRCLQFNLRPMAPETVLEHLTRVLQTESVPAEPQALRLIARAARGSMRDALSLTDQAIAFGNGELQESGVRHMLGSVDRGHVFRLIEALAQGDGKTVVETAEGLRRDGLSAASTLEEMTAVLQGMAVLQAVPSRVGADTGGDPEAAETARLAALMPADETQLLYSLCLHGRTELGLAPDEYAALTMVLLRLLAFKPSGAATEEKKTLNEAPRREVPLARVAPAEAAPPVAVAPPSVDPAAAPLAPAARPGHRLPVVDAPALNVAASARPVATDEPEPAPTKVMAVPVRVQPPAGAREGESMASAASHPIPPSEEGDFWYATVTQMVAAESIAALARELALQSQLVARDVDQWLLRVERESLNQSGSRDKVQAALAALGHDVKIAIEIGSVVDSPARRNKQAAEERQRVAEEAIRNDPDVQSMMRDWDARIVPGTLRPV